MSTSTWGDAESNPDEVFPLSLSKHLLQQMMAQFGAQGGCIALLDENIGQMRIQAHLRIQGAGPPNSPPGSHYDTTAPAGARSTGQLGPESSPPHGHLRSFQRKNGEPQDVNQRQSELFAVGTTYPLGQDLIGYTWHKKDAYIMRHEDYLMFFQAGRPLSFKTDVTPTSYLVTPIQESTRLDEMRGRKRQPEVSGVVLLYRFTPDAPEFQPKQRNEALQYVERIALYLQNDKLRRAQRRSNEYLQLLQEISLAFPTSVKLSDLVESIYQFAARVVDISSMLLTLYDRDLDRLYDVLAVCNGERLEGLAEHPNVVSKEERPLWWKLIQQERRTLLFSPAQDQQRAAENAELLTGVWGDQRQAESFLLLPMRMYNRTIGALCLTSMHPNAYRQEEIQALETMAQIVTMSIENSRLYERDRQLLHEARQREGQLAAINSALQSINSVLNVTELLTNLVESVARIVKVDVCVFFQLSPNREELIAHALYAPTSVRMVDDGSGLPTEPPHRSKGEPDALISLICIPFKDTALEQMSNESFFYLDRSKLEELAQQCNETVAIFLEEMKLQHLLMIPMTYQTELIGILAVPTPRENRSFRPKEVGTLLAICAQAASAIRNAQLFEQREEAYAELQRMDKLKDEFLVTASHELRTPLSAISGYSSLLKRQSARATPQEITRFATKIADAAQQLLQLVSNMTEAAKMGAVDKKLDLHIESVQLLSAAGMAVNMLFSSGGHEVAVEIPPNFWVSGDGPRIRQVLTNLIENAVKYSAPKSSIHVTARTTTLSQIEMLLPEDQIDHELLLEQGHQPVVLVRVKDQGEGIIEEDQPRIFEKFVRAPRSLTTPVRGSGLGLYISRRAIEAMGGKLWLEQSIPKEGSTFSFYLPYVEPPVDMET